MKIGIICNFGPYPDMGGSIGGSEFVIKNIAEEAYLDHNNRVANAPKDALFEVEYINEVLLFYKIRSSRGLVGELTFSDEHFVKATKREAFLFHICGTNALVGEEGKKLNGILY